MNNEKMIQDLRSLADHMESHPEFPQVEHMLAWTHVGTIAEFKEAARNMGSFTKKFDNYYVTLEKMFGAVKVNVQIGREQVCKKIVTWECPDDPLLAPLPGDEVAIHD